MSLDFQDLPWSSTLVNLGAGSPTLSVFTAFPFLSWACATPPTTNAVPPMANAVIVSTFSQRMDAPPKMVMFAPSRPRWDRHGPWGMVTISAARGRVNHWPRKRFVYNFALARALGALNASERTGMLGIKLNPRQFLDRVGTELDKIDPLQVQTLADALHDCYV